MAENDILPKLLSLRIVPLAEIVAESVTRVKRDMLSLVLESDKPIILFIDSPGGVVVQGFSLIDFISMLDVDIIGIVNGKCASMAVPVLQVCTRRLATKHSHFFLHPLSTERKYWNDDDLQRVAEDDRRRLENLHQQYLDLIMRKLKKSREEANATIKQGEKYGGFLTSVEALDWGLVDELLPDEFKLFRREELTTRQIRLAPMPVKID